MSNQESTSLNKYLSQSGLCSRREADKWIEAGRVTLNGKTAKKGNRVAIGDEVLLDGQPLFDEPKKVYIVFNKPQGITCTTDRNDKDNIIDFIGHEQRIFPVGRLDKASSGLILLTNDGDIVNRILRAENKKEKEYIVAVDRPINKGFVQKMSQGVPILGTVTRECEVEAINKTNFRIVLTQGLNRQIRRMCEHLGYHVRALTRVRIMHIHIGHLKPGRWRNLTKGELKQLFASI